MKLYYHKTDGGAEYLCSENIKGTSEGSLRSKFVIRVDGDIRKDTELFIKEDKKRIAYLNAEDSANLEYDTPTCLTNNPLDRKIDAEKSQSKAILEHPNTEFYTIEDFVRAFNDEFISDLGFIALDE